MRFEGFGLQLWLSVLKFSVEFSHCHPENEGLSAAHEFPSNIPVNSLAPIEDESLDHLDEKREIGALFSAITFGISQIPTFIGLIPTILGAIPTILGLLPTILSMLPAILSSLPEIVGLLPMIIGMVS